MTVKLQDVIKGKFGQTPHLNLILIIGFYLNQTQRYSFGVSIQ